MSIIVKIHSILNRPSSESQVDNFFPDFMGSLKTFKAPYHSPLSKFMIDRRLIGVFTFLKYFRISKTSNGIKVQFTSFNLLLSMSIFVITHYKSFFLANLSFPVLVFVFFSYA